MRSIGIAIAIAVVIAATAFAVGADMERNPIAERHGATAQKLVALRDGIEVGAPRKRIPRDWCDSSTRATGPQSSVQLTAAQVAGVRLPLPAVGGDRAAVLHYVYHFILHRNSVVIR